jgi:hypothetical protein
MMFKPRGLFAGSKKRVAKAPAIHARQEGSA